MFPWTLLSIILIFDFLSINNCGSVNSSTEILPAEYNLDDDLNNLIDISKINDNGDKQQEVEEHEEEYAYDNVVEVGNNTIKAGNDTLDLKVGACQLDISILGSMNPLLRNPQTRHMLLPDRAGTTVITMQAGEHMDVDCPGSYIVIDARTFVLREVADAICIGRNLFRIGSNRVNMARVRCAEKVKSTARFMRSGCWNDQGREMEVGYLFKDGHFLQQYKSCFHQTIRKVFYSTFKLMHQIEDHQALVPQANFEEANAYRLRVTVKSLYVNARQKSIINRQVGLPVGSTKYIKSSRGTNYFLAKGHLAAKADFMYQVQQEATFYFINHVPQWHYLNLFNWAAMEYNVRSYATRTGLDLVIMTGGYGTATLPHERTGNPVELHLFVDGNFRAIPVPAQIWKVVYSPSTQAGIAFLALNNPYIPNGPQQHICQDVYDRLNWVTFDRTVVNRGYMYACTIPDIRRVIPQIPNYNVRRMLT